MCAQAFEPLIKWTKKREQQRNQDKADEPLQKGRLEAMSRVVGVDMKVASPDTSDCGVSALNQNQVDLSAFEEER